MIQQRLLVGITHEKAVRNYIKALNKGILKVMSKMGISTLQSYCGAQIFEAVGLDKAFVDRYFTWTASRIGGIGVDVVADEVLKRHGRAFPTRAGAQADLEWGGEYQWRRDGEYHLFNPDTVFKLQHSTRSGQYAVFKEYSRLVDDQNRDRATLRGLLELRPAGEPVPLDEVEPVEADRPALCDRRDVVRVDQPGSARDARDRDEPARRKIEHRRGRRGSGARRARRERRLAPQRGPSGRLGPVRRDEPVPGELHRPADQDGAGREAGRRRPAARRQGLSLDREGPLRDAGRRPDLAAAAPRHLLDRGSGAAHSRPQEFQPAGADSREARRARRRRHRRRRRREGARRRRADLGPRRRHRRIAAHQHQARRRAVGARPGRDAAGADDERPARSHRRAGGRTAEDRPRRRGRRADGRGGVRLRDRAAGRLRLHHDAGLPSQHLPGRHRHAGPRAAQELHRQAGVRRELLPVHRRRKSASTWRSSDSGRWTR